MGQPGLCIPLVVFVFLVFQDWALPAWSVDSPGLKESRGTDLCVGTFDCELSTVDFPCGSIVHFGCNRSSRCEDQTSHHDLAMKLLTVNCRLLTFY